MKFFHKRPVTAIALMQPSHSWSTRSGCFDNYQNRLIMGLMHSPGEDFQGHTLMFGNIQFRRPVRYGSSEIGAWSQEAFIYQRPSVVSVPRKGKFGHYEQKLSCLGV